MRWRPALSSCSSREPAVVDWPALLDAAPRGHIRAAVDVFPEEPIPAKEPARTTRGTILSAHRAGNVPEIWRQVGEMVVDDLEALAAGRQISGTLPARCAERIVPGVVRARSATGIGSSGNTSTAARM